MFHEDWWLADVFTVDQASWLWCEMDPPQYSSTHDPRVAAILQMLGGAVATKALPADHQFNSFRSLGDFKRSTVTRDALCAFAKSKQQYPAFLFDTIARSLLDNDAPIPVVNKGGEAAEV